MVMTQPMTETVARVMTAHPIIVHPETTVAQLHALMEEYGVAACPVVTDTGELCGMASRVDILRAIRPTRELDALEVAEAWRLPVHDIMRRGVVTLEAGDPLVAALDLFVDSRLHALPVVRRGAGRPVLEGIITQADILRHLVGGSGRGLP